MACGWFDTWVNGDATARKEAVAAMRPRARWPVLKEMEREGAYGEVLLQYVDAMAANGKVVGRQAAHGRGVLQGRPRLLAIA